MWLLTACIIIASCAQAAPYQPLQRGGYQDPVGDLRHEIENHEAEIRMFEQRLNTQEAILDSIRQDLMDYNTSSQGNSNSLESSLSKTSSEIRNLQNHSNETAKALSVYKQKIESLEVKIDHLQSSLQSILDALNVNVSTGGESYAVKSGDSLEKIARRNNTTIQKLKELNSLKSDRIFIGQKLKLP